MTYTFPVEKDDFTAENGITYSWKTDHWVVKAYKGDNAVHVGEEPPDKKKLGDLWL